MVETRRQRAYYDEYDEHQYRQALRQSLIEAGEFQKGKVTRSVDKKKGKKTVTLSNVNTTIKARVTRRKITTKKPSNTALERSIRLVGVNYQALPYELMSKWQRQGTIKAPKVPSDYWPHPNFPGIKLGHNPWQHLNWHGPSERDVLKVNTLLDERHAEFEHQSYVDAPTHATQSAVNIDVCIQTILAQSTGNEIAIDTHCRLRNTFTYEKDGRRIAGKIPNWHTIRCLHQEELEEALKQGGFHLVRAKAIKELLTMVYSTNLRRKRAGVQKFLHDGSPPDAEDFVPGLLSLDFISNDVEDSNEAILGRLLNLPQIGLKSAQCIMAFAMKRECFPVDVHVLRMSKWLGWLPPDCDDPKRAAMFLHAYVPGRIMFNLHQAIWIHCANENTRISDSRDTICLVCGSSPPPKRTNIEKALKDCPLTAMLPPLARRWGKRYKTPEMTAKMSIVVKQTGVPTTDLRDIMPSTPIIQEDESSSEETLVNSDTASNVSTPIYDTPMAASFKPVSPSPIKKNKKINVSKATSIRFEDLPEDMIEEVQRAGFLLWEFRPMDNSFMEEYGKVEKFPRYKWERPEIMDPQVAVTVEYAKEVLTGKRKHKWSIADIEDVAVAQAINAVTTK